MALSIANHRFSFNSSSKLARDSKQQKDIKKIQQKRNHRQTTIVFTFVIQDFYHKQSYPYDKVQLNVQNLQKYTNVMWKSINKKLNIKQDIITFIKDQRKYISFQKLKNIKQFSTLLDRKEIVIEYLYKNKRDQLRKTLIKFQQQAKIKHKFMQEINQTSGQGSKFMFFKRIASSKQGIQANLSFQLKIKIILFVSDPLVRQTNIAVGHEQIDLEQHLKILKQSSKSSKSLRISVNRYYALQNNIHNVFADQKSKVIKIVHFFTSVIKKAGEIYLVFQEKENIGQQKLIKVCDFFERQEIQKSKINLLIFIGNNVNILKTCLPKSINFSIILLSTYSANKQQSFQFFIKSFYQNFFERNQIKQSFLMAIEEYKKKYYEKNGYYKNFFCCCMHDHQQNCSWHKIIQKIGLPLAHKMFYHRLLHTKDYSSVLTYKIQGNLIKDIQLSDGFTKCTQQGQICCKNSHIARKYVLQKIQLIENELSQQIFSVSSNVKTFIKNQFKYKFVIQSNIKRRRCPLIIYELVSKILKNKGKIIQFVVGYKRIGKSNFIQSACQYIKLRKNYYQFQNVDLTQRSFHQCVKYMENKAKTFKTGNKKIVFIHHNNSMEVEKEYLQYFKQKNSSQNYTFLIKILGNQQTNPNFNSSLDSIVDNNSAVYLKKLQKWDIICEIYYEFQDSFFQDKKNLDYLYQFADFHHKKLNYRNLRMFLRYYHSKKSNSLYNRTFQSIYNETFFQSNEKIKNLQKQNLNLFTFIGFISQFQQGIYLTKLNLIIFKQVFQIDDLKALIRNRQYVNYFFQVIPKVTIFNKSSGIKNQKIDFILPQDIVINYFKDNPQKSDTFKILKNNYFYYFFNILWQIIQLNHDVVRNKYKRQRNILQQGIFLIQISKNRSLSQIDQQLINKIINQMQIVYESQLSLVYDETKYDKQKMPSIFTDIKKKVTQMKDKILTIIFHQTERYILYRHMTNIAKIFKHQKRQINITISHGNRNSIFQDCPLLFYKKILSIYKILLKDDQRYDQITKNLSNLCPKILSFYKQKGNQLFQRIVQQKQYHSQHFLSNFSSQSRIFQVQRKQIDFKSLSFKKYFQKIIILIQIQIILIKKETFNLKTGDYIGKKSINQNKQKGLTQMKQSIQKLLFNLLPQIRRKSKSQSILLLNQVQLKNQHQKQTNFDNQAIDNETDEQKLLIILKKLIKYEIIQIHLRQYYHYQYVLNETNKQIQLFSDIIQKTQQIKNDYYDILKYLTKQELFMQILRLQMRKVQIHFKLKKQNNILLSEYTIRQAINLPNVLYCIQTYDILLLQSLKNKQNQYFNSQKLNMYFKNMQICQNYIKSINGSYKVTDDFYLWIKQIQPNFKDIFEFICERTWKKMLFNSSNNIVFLKSRVMVHDTKPYCYVRKRNITMKYVKQILLNYKVNITFLHLTKNNINYIQVDKIQNPYCKIKYLVLTVDCFQKQNGDIYMLFEQNNNILQEIVDFKTFLQIISQIKFQVLILMGKKTSKLAKKLYEQLKSLIVIISFQNPQFGLNNFIQYKDSIVINQSDQYSLPIFEQTTSSIQRTLTNQIFRYMDVESYHCLLDMIICTLISEFIQISQKQSQHNNHFHHEFERRYATSYKKISEMIVKSIKLSKQIMKTKWQRAKDIQILYKIYPQQPEVQVSSSLKKHFSLAGDLSLQTPSLVNVMSLKESHQTIIYLPQFQKGKINDNTLKMFQSPTNLNDQQYYQNVGRLQQLYQILTFIQNSGHRIVEIYGDFATGKTSFLQQICWINQVSRLFKDGVYYFNVKELSRTCQTLMEHIQIRLKEHKLLTTLSQSCLTNKTQKATILIGLDNLNIKDIKQNHDFFQKLKNKPICIIYSTSQSHLIDELKSYLKIKCDSTGYTNKKNQQSSVSLILNSPELFANRKSSSSDYHLTQIIQKKKSTGTQSLRSQSSVSFNSDAWLLHKVDLNRTNKHALFSIAMSFLKRKQISHLPINLSQFIKNHFASFINETIQQITGNAYIVPQHFGKKYSVQSNSRSISSSRLSVSDNLEQKNSQTFYENKEVENLILQNLKSVQSNASSENKSARINQTSKIDKLLKSLNSYFQNLGQKLSKSTFSIQQTEAQSPSLQKYKNVSTKIILDKGKDTRLGFYQDCFQQLRLRNRTYDQIKLKFV